MIDIKTKGIKKLVRDLEATKKKALPFAVRDSLNSAAFEGRKVWQGEMKDRLVLRNQFVAKSARVKKANGLNIKTMQSRLGSDFEGLERQESGGVSTGYVPSRKASGEGYGSGMRKKLVRGPNKMTSIQLMSNRRRKGSRRQRNAAAIRQAAKAGKKYVHLELQNQRGLFKVSGGRRNPKVDLIWDLRSKRHRIPPNPTMGPALRKLSPRLPAMYQKSLINQLKLHRVLGY